MASAIQQGPEGVHVRTLPKPSRPLLGQLLLAGGAVTADQLREALCRQQESGRLLGEILVDMGAITPTQLEDALQEQRRLDSSD